MGLGVKCQISSPATLAESALLVTGRDRPSRSHPNENSTLEPDRRRRTGVNLNECHVLSVCFNPSHAHTWQWQYPAAVASARKVQQELIIDFKTCGTARLVVSSDEDHPRSSITWVVIAERAYRFVDAISIGQRRLSLNLVALQVGEKGTKLFV